MTERRRRRWPPWPRLPLGPSGRGASVGALASRLLALDRSRRLGVAGQPGARAARQPRPAAGRRVHGRRARRRAASASSTCRRCSGAFIRTACWSAGRSSAPRWRSRRSAGGGRGSASRSRPRSTSRTPPWAATSCRSSGTTCCSSAACSPRSCRAIAARRSFTSCFGSCSSSSTSSRASPSGSRRSRDWQDGSAMTFYYETAPLPTWLAFTAHHLPVWWHHFESRATLVLELVVPFADLRAAPRAPRPPRSLFTCFQICNAATANYGFFCYLAAALHVFLLDDVDVDRAGARAARCLPAAIRGGVERRSSSARRRRRGGAGRDRAAAAAATVRWLGRAGAALLRPRVARRRAATRSPSRDAVLSVAAPLFELNRAVSPGEQLPPVRRRSRASGSSPSCRRWPAADGAEPPIGRRRPLDAARSLAQAGRSARAPDFVAPHQPRVDFQLWFYGLGVPPARADVRLHAASSECARIRPPCSRSFANRSRRTPPPCASSTGATSSPAAPSGAPPAPGGRARAWPSSRAIPCPGAVR